MDQVSLTDRIESVLDLSQGEYEEWLRANKKSLGGSLVGTLMGLNKWSNPELVWESILQLTERQPDNKHLRRGRKMEQIVTEEYEFVTHRVVTKIEKKHHPTIPYLHGSPDRVIIGGDDIVSLGVLEAKCPAKWQWAAMKSEGVPATYYVQAQHYMNVLGIDWGSYAALNAEEWMLGYCDFSRNDEVIAKIEEVCEYFWNDFVVPRIRPKPDRLPVVLSLPKLEMKLWTP